MKNININVLNTYEVTGNDIGIIYDDIQLTEQFFEKEECKEYKTEITFGDITGRDNDTIYYTLYYKTVNQYVNVDVVNSDGEMVAVAYFEI